MYRDLPQDFFRAVILVPNTSEVLFRQSRAERSRLAEWLLWLIRYEEARLHQGPREVPFEMLRSRYKPPYQMLCAVCDAYKALDLKDERKRLEDLPLYVCKECVMPFHKLCAQQCCNKLDFDFETFICPFCLKQI